MDALYRQPVGVIQMLRYSLVRLVLFLEHFRMEMSSYGEGLVVVFF